MSKGDIISECLQRESVAQFGCLTFNDMVFINTTKPLIMTSLSRFIIKYAEIRNVKGLKKIT